MQWLLAAMIVVPLVGGILLSLIPDTLTRFARPAALVLTGGILVASAWLWILPSHVADANGASRVIPTCARTCALRGTAIRMAPYKNFCAGPRPFCTRFPNR